MMRLNRLRIAELLLVSTMVASCASVPQGSEPRAVWEEQTPSFAPLAPSVTAVRTLSTLADRLAERDQFSGVILVADKHGTVIEKAYGLADREAKIAVTHDKQFALASIGKLFTTTAILQLVEQGKIGLDEPIIRYLPDYPNKQAASKITIRHLLTHSSGFGNIDIFVQRNTHRNVRETQDFGQGTLHDNNIHKGYTVQVPITRILADEVTVIVAVQDGTAEQTACKFLVFLILELC